MASRYGPRSRASPLAWSLYRHHVRISGSVAAGRLSGVSLDRVVAGVFGPSGESSHISLRVM